MVSLTLRNIPEELLKRIRSFAVRERRSLNSELLMILEEGLSNRLENRRDSFEGISSAGRERLWNELCGVWKDRRSVQDQMAGIWALRAGKKPAETANTPVQDKSQPEEIKP